MKTPTFQEQMHFMSCQAEMLDDEGNDVSAGVMRDATKILVVEHKRVLELEAEVSRLNESLDKATDTQCDQILKMTDKQIEALCRLEGHDPKDEATIAKQVCEIALLKYELEKVTRAQPEELSAEWVPEAAKQTGEVLRARSSEMFPWECINDASSRPHIKDMLGKLERREISGNKAHRWLGWAQGVICARAGVPLETFKTINKAASLTRSPPMRTKPKECENGCPPQQVCDYCQGVRSCKPQLWQSK